MAKLSKAEKRGYALACRVMAGRRKVARKRSYRTRTARAYF